MYIDLILQDLNLFQRFFHDLFNIKLALQTLHIATNKFIRKCLFHKQIVRRLSLRELVIH